MRKISNVKKSICISGNHASYLFKNLNAPPFFPEMMVEENRYPIWERDRLSKASLKFIRELPARMDIKRHGFSIPVIHYGAGSDTRYLDSIRNPTVVDCEYLFSIIASDIFLNSRTHGASLVQAENRICMNAGLLGYPHTAQGTAKAGILELNDGKADCRLISIS